ncbi:hypothetical protein JXJ21_22860 [candidate division KSB1 bacterium]|nr:hypothetical protein [candidate division KSB1 bacterium]
MGHTYRSHEKLAIPTFRIDSAQRSFTFFINEHERCGIFDATFQLEVNERPLNATLPQFQTQVRGELSAGKSATFTLTHSDAGIVWEILLELSKNGLTGYISSVIRNSSDSPVALGKCDLIHIKRDQGVLVPGENQGSTVLLESHASAALRRVLPISENDGRHSTKTIMHLFNRVNSVAVHLSFITFDYLNTEHHLHYANRKGIFQYRAFCDFSGFILQPGKSISTEKIMLEIRTDPYASLESWADHVRNHYHPEIWSTPPAGWLGWAWVDPFTVENYQDIVYRNAAAIKRRLNGFGLEYIWISIGNLEDGFPGNWLNVDSRNFPDGIRNLAEKLKPLGIKPGLWISPFWICSALPDLVRKMDDALLRDENGEYLVVCPEWRIGKAGELPKAERPCCYALDGSHPRTIETLKHTFETYREWGVRYFMIDFLEGGAGNISRYPYAKHHDSSMVAGPQIYRNALRVIREAAGKDTYLLSSTGPTFHNVGLVDGARVGSDYGEGRALFPESYFYPATFIINNARFWTSHHHASTNMATNYFMHRKLFLCDSGNVLTVDKPIPLSDARIAITIFGINGGPVMLGDDLDRISEERLALIKKCLPRAEDIAFPLDLFEAAYPDYPKIFHLHIEKEWDQWEILAIFNYDAVPLSQDIDLRKLGFCPDETVTLWEFWNEQYLGSASGKFTAGIPPGNVGVYRIAKRRSHPWLLSTDMHVRQGQAELLDVNWNEAEMSLLIRASRPAAEIGNIFVIAPKGVCVANPRGNWIAKDANDESLIIRREFRFKDEPAEWRLRFKPLE